MQALQQAVLYSVNNFDDFCLHIFYSVESCARQEASACYNSINSVGLEMKVNTVAKYTCQTNKGDHYTTEGQ